MKIVGKTSKTFVVVSNLLERAMRFHILLYSGLLYRKAEYVEDDRKYFENSHYFIILHLLCGNTLDKRVRISKQQILKSTILL